MQGTMWLFPDSRDWGMGNGDSGVGNREPGASSLEPAYIVSQTKGKLLNGQAKRQIWLTCTSSAGCAQWKGLLHKKAPSFIYHLPFEYHSPREPPNARWRAIRYADREPPTLFSLIRSGEPHFYHYAIRCKYRC